MPSSPLYILGTRGIPASHGGFETFAEKFSRYLADRDFNVFVYCQRRGWFSVCEDSWSGVNRISISVPGEGALSTIVFDLLCVVSVLFRQGKILVLGYNTAVFLCLLRLAGRSFFINMDGIEWKREKWGGGAKAWFFVNEAFGCWLGSFLIADHPLIKEHLLRRAKSSKISVIPYGADAVLEPDLACISQWGLVPGKYMLVIARPEPENSILEIVSAFSRRSRGIKLVVLGKYEESNSYCASVRQAASSEVLFVGAVYDDKIVSSLRFFCRSYIHGHRVGGTNPSLVEALAAGSAVLAHDNGFNRWVLGGGGCYFSSVDECDASIGRLCADDSFVSVLKNEAVLRHRGAFDLLEVNRAYERLIFQ